MHQKFLKTILIILSASIMLTACRNTSVPDASETPVSDTIAETYLETHAIEEPGLASEEADREVKVTTEVSTEETTPMEVQADTTEHNDAVTQPTESEPVITDPTTTETNETTFPEIVETFPPYMTDLG